MPAERESFACSLRHLYHQCHYHYHNHFIVVVIIIVIIKSLSKIQSFIRLLVENGNDFHIGITKRRLHDRKTEHFKSLTNK